MSYEGGQAIWPSNSNIIIGTRRMYQQANDAFHSYRELVNYDLRDRKINWNRSTKSDFPLRKSKIFSVLQL